MALRNDRTLSRYYRLKGTKYIYETIQADFVTYTNQSEWFANIVVRQTEDHSDVQDYDLPADFAINFIPISDMEALIRLVDK